MQHLTARDGSLFNNSQPISVGAGTPWVTGGSRHAGNGFVDGSQGDIQEVLVLIRRKMLPLARVKPQRVGASLVSVRRGKPKRMGMGPTSIELLAEIELKSLILAQIERWRHALHMQVERQRGGNPGGERRTGE